jgi:hypothetical protein
MTATSRMGNKRGGDVSRSDARPKVLNGGLRLDRGDKGDCARAANAKKNHSSPKEERQSQHIVSFQRHESHSHSVK